MDFSIIKTNIVNMETDAIVLPANTHLKEGSGTSAAIFEAAGRKELKAACKAIGSCEVGSAVPTYAYNLNARFIIHTVVPKWVDGRHNEYDLLSSAYLSALNLADVMGCTSIAFPLLASGNNGFDRELAFRIAQESINAFQGTSLQKVVLVVFGDKVESFVKSLGYSVSSIPGDLFHEEHNHLHKEKMKKMVEDGKELALDIIEKQMQKGLDFLKDEENQKKLFAMGVAIVKFVMTKNSPGKGVILKK